MNLLTSPEALLPYSLRVFDLPPQSPKVNSKRVRALEADQK